jgi:hypothetical protein
VEDAERERHERRIARDRRRREQGKPAYFESDAKLDSWRLSDDQSYVLNSILRIWFDG